MNLTPVAPNLRTPTFIQGLTLAVAQVAVGFLTVALLSFVTTVPGGTFGLLAAMVTAMSYALWAEKKVPDALSEGSLRRRLAAVALLIQAVPIFPLLYATMSPAVGTIAIVILWLVSTTMGWGATLLGLSMGRRLAIKQRPAIKAP